MRPRSTSKRCIEPPLPLTIPVPLQERVGVVAVGGDDPVALLEGLQESRSHCLLAGVDVEVASDLALPEAPPARLLERPDEHHLAIEVHETIRARGYRALVTGLRFPVFRVPVLCRHIRPLPTSRYNLTNDEQDSTLRRLVRIFYCPYRPDVCTILRRCARLAPPATRGAPGRPSPGANLYACSHPSRRT